MHGVRQASPAPTAAPRDSSSQGTPACASSSSTGSARRRIDSAPSLSWQLRPQGHAWRVPVIKDIISRSMKNLQIFHLLAALVFGTINSASAHLIKSDSFFTYTLPSNWKIHDNGKIESCHFFKNTHSPNTTEWDLKACKYSGTLENVLRFTVFIKDGKKWIASGSMDQQPAAWRSNDSNFTFIETKYPPTCGIIDRKSGFHAAGGHCYSALIRCKNNHVVIESNGLNTDFPVMQKIARSVIFKECTRNSSVKNR